jgi:hypothetical protein
LTEYRTAASCHPLPTNPGTVKRGIWLPAPPRRPHRRHLQAAPLARWSASAVGCTGFHMNGITDTLIGTIGDKERKR